MDSLPREMHTHTHMYTSIWVYFLTQMFWSLWLGNLKTGIFLVAPTLLLCNYSRDQLQRRPMHPYQSTIYWLCAWDWGGHWEHEREETEPLLSGSNGLRRTQVGEWTVTRYQLWGTVERKWGDSQSCRELQIWWNDECNEHLFSVLCAGIWTPFYAWTWELDHKEG